MDSTTNRRPLLTGSLIAAPLLFLIGQALLPAMPVEWSRAFPMMVEHRDQLIASRLLSAAGAFLFVPAAVALVALLSKNSTGSRALRLGAWLVAIGSFFNAVSQVVAGYATYAATDATVDRAARDVGLGD